MNEKQFEEELLNLIRKFRDKKIGKEDFVHDLKVLANKSIPQQIADFKDEDLGWAKTWISEIDYYGFEEMMKSKFNYIDFLNKKELKANQTK